MRISRVCLGWMMAAAIPALAAAQATAPAAPATAQKPSEAEDKDRTVAGGGVTVPGWTGKVDAKATAAGMTRPSAIWECTRRRRTSSPRAPRAGLRSRCSTDAAERRAGGGPTYLAIQPQPPVVGRRAVRSPSRAR